MVDRAHLRQGDGLISPKDIPGTDVEPALIAEAAAGFTRTGAAVRDKGAAVVGAWSGLASVYTAPESIQLLDSMTPVGSETTALGDTMNRVGGALADFADAVAPIKRRLVALQAEAHEFVASVHGGVTVAINDPDHPAYDASQWSLIVTDIADMGPKVIPWDRHEPSVRRNRELIEEVNEQVVRLDQAQADCVNEIRNLRSDLLANYVPLTVDELNIEGMVLPWGAPTNGDRNCYESVNDGIAANFTALLEGAGLLLGHDAKTGRWLDGNIAGPAWVGTATMLGSLVIAPSIWTVVGKVAPAGALPSPIRDLSTSAYDNVGQVVDGLVGSPERWQKNPAEAAGGLGFNAATFFVPAGPVVSGLKAGTLAARLSSLGGIVADTVLPGLASAVRISGSALMHGASALGEVVFTVRVGLVSGTGAARAALLHILAELSNRTPGNTFPSDVAVPLGESGAFDIESGRSADSLLVEVKPPPAVLDFESRFNYLLEVQVDRTLPGGRLVPETYDPLGGMSRADFLRQFWDPDEIRSDGSRGKWIYPKNRGFDESVEIVEVDLPVGYRFDRYGGTAGAFVAPEGTPFPGRGLPPDALNRLDLYFAYELLRPFDQVTGRPRLGVAAPAFGQRGGGPQLELPRSIKWLLSHQYIVERSSST